jgi:nitroreductase
MPNNPLSISTLIHRRRSVFPKFYLPEKPIDRALIEQLLENANWAPTHRLTEPWRFQVFHSPESRAALGDYLAGYYQHYTLPDAYSEDKFEKNRINPRRAGAVIAIILHRDPAESVPEFEEIASVAMAVQNMWLTCTELGLGCYWSSPKAALEASEFLQLQANEFCLGLFYLGWHEMPEIAGKRKAVGEKVRWR